MWSQVQSQPASPRGTQLDPQKCSGIRTDHLFISSCIGSVEPKQQLLLNHVCWDQFGAGLVCSWDVVLNLIVARDVVYA